MAKQLKLGLALSGGGFRASLFHIGVLARLAEMRLLRSLEVLSAVSGGSIIAALYYLHLKRLLESKPDRQIQPSDYIGLVKQIESDFVAGVQKNLRTRAYADFGKNWKMIRDRSFTRSDRMAELYDEFFYDKPAGRTRVPLRALKIHPKKGPKNFHPDRHNANRTNKVPKLILNATTLNSGRNWQFSAVDAGEHEPIKKNEQARVDAYNKNFLLRAFRYENLNENDKYKDFPLSIAVASSACVPGIFPPLPLTDLYKDVTPKLVDGGVYDNQGISALLYEECSHVIVSDGSGQMDNEAKSGSGLLSVLPRTNSVLMDRIRDEGFELLETMKDSGEVKEYSFFHLREGFPVEKLDPQRIAPAQKEHRSASLKYGINAEVQNSLSSMRTDLDSFTDTECYSMMYSGYRISREAISFSFMRALKAGGSRPADEEWRFNVIGKDATAERPPERYTKQLKVSAELLFKAYRLMPSLRILGFLILLIALGAAGGVLYFAERLIAWFDLWPYVISLIIVFIGALVIGLVFKRASLKRLWEEFVLQYVVTLSAALFGTLLAKLHLKWIDPKFLKYGRVKTLMEKM